MKEMCDLINTMQGAVSVISVASPWVMHLLKVLRDISTSGRNSSLTVKCQALCQLREFFEDRSALEHDVKRWMDACRHE